MKLTFDDSKITASGVLFPEDVYEADNNALSKTLLGMSVVDSGKLPLDVIWNLGNRAFVAIVPPQQHLLHFTNANAIDAATGSHDEYVATIYVPRTLLGVICQNYMPQKVFNVLIPESMSPDGSLWHTPCCLVPLPNLYGDSSVCLPSSQVELPSHDLRGSLSLAYDLTWNGRYNTDLLDAMRYVNQGSPSMLWNKVVKMYRESSIRAGRETLAPNGSALQIIKAWEALSPEEVESIRDWRFVWDNVRAFIAHMHTQAVGFGGKKSLIQSLSYAIREVGEALEQTTDA